MGSTNSKNSPLPQQNNAFFNLFYLLLSGEDYLPPDIESHSFWSQLFRGYTRYIVKERLQHDALSKPLDNIQIGNTISQTENVTDKQKSSSSAHNSSTLLHPQDQSTPSPSPINKTVDADDQLIPRFALLRTPRIEERVTPPPGVHSKTLNSSVTVMSAGEHQYIVQTFSRAFQHMVCRALDSNSEVNEIPRINLDLMLRAAICRGIRFKELKIQISFDAKDRIVLNTVNELYGALLLLKVCFQALLVSVDINSDSIDQIYARDSSSWLEQDCQLSSGSIKNSTPTCQPASEQRSQQHESQHHSGVLSSCILVSLYTLLIELILSSNSDAYPAIRSACIEILIISLCERHFLPKEKPACLIPRVLAVDSSLVSSLMCTIITQYLEPVDAKHECRNQNSGYTSWLLGKVWKPANEQEKSNPPPNQSKVIPQQQVVSLNTQIRPVNDQAMMLLIMLCSVDRHSKRNPYLETLTSFTAFSEGNGVFIRNTYTIMSTWLDDERGILLLYYMIQANSKFKTFLLALTDPDIFVLPLLKHTYTQSIRNVASAYVSSMIILHLCGDHGFLDAICRLRIPWAVLSWFPESKVAKDEYIDLNTLVVLVSLRTVQNCTGKSINRFMVKISLGIVANVSRSILDADCNLAEKFISLFEYFLKQHRKLVLMTADGGRMTQRERRTKIGWLVDIEDYIATTLEILINMLRCGSSRNLSILYSIGQRPLFSKLDEVSSISARCCALSKRLKHVAVSFLKEVDALGKSKNSLSISTKKILEKYNASKTHELTQTLDDLPQLKYSCKEELDADFFSQHAWDMVSRFSIQNWDHHKPDWPYKNQDDEYSF